MKIKRAVFVSLALIAATPIALLTFVRPLRVAALPLVPGIECPQSNICVDDPARLAEAQTLYQAAYEKAVAGVGPFQHVPRVVFCTTDSCAEAFGLGKRAGETVGDVGLVIAPRGWKTYYLAHELIHYRQAESLGNLAMFTKPKWLIEGMAYSLSGDPRHPLTSPFEQWRSQFDVWHAGIGSRGLWEAARDAH